ncbi:5-oxoprolinase subunit PxpB [Novilysobacter spongiicola]|uniref:Sensor histidine kinase inhibitor, KipI family n=1 Tax=Lysobacter spongiicola DSM 21749 TaxID=1122188 RepID=A0A1T4MPH8_9GAMM|nr:5-oxoprolinase subunit PxpB [Lysobacter spongiicola]SJZ69020.1 sensor histidine kinase inhibitor, KipI family [Lysobacter spongiicola DSM 21749]
MSTGRPAIEPLADDAWLLVFGDVIDDQLNRRVHATATRLSAVGLEGVQDIVPAYASLAVFFDPGEVDRDRVRQHLLDAALSDTGAVEAVRTREVDVPVLYGGAAGPDLDTAAAELGMQPDELVRRHASGQYTVAMIGFAPGFPYLSGLDADLALPRLDSPRVRVAAGSVGIAGAQTGIYPRESPGGWHLLGRTPLTLFDPLREPPCSVAPGDRVRFTSIDVSEFDRLAGDQGAGNA